MKITHTPSGKAYQLTPGTQLEIDRTNPFFNEWGEQTLPVTLPDTDVNRQLIGFPDQIANRKKLPSRINVTIEDGDYYMNCRQAILGSTRKKGITTTFYINEGSFYEKIKEVTLKSIFGEETIPGITTVQHGINFCKRMLTISHPEYAIFPIQVDGDDGQRKWINRVEWMNSDGEHIFPIRKLPSNLTLGLYNQFARQEKVSDNTIRLDPGYYISPFIRAGYLLRRVFNYFGYQLQDNLFNTYPFSDMVFINNVMDTLVNGDIRISHLVPDCMCTTFLEAFRKKFHCEFIPDEIHKTVTIKFFKDTVKAHPTIDLTNSLTSELEINYPGTYKQLQLTSDKIITDTGSFDSIFDLLAKYPTAYFNPIDGAYYRTGFIQTRKITEKISSSALPYYTGGNLGTEEIKCPDAIYPLIPEAYDEALKTTDASGRPGTSKVKKRTSIYLPYIGKSQALNSTLNIPTKEEDEDEKDQTSEKTENNEQSPMFAYAYMWTSGGFYLGTNTNYSLDNTRLSDYSLCYNGPDGIFEKFYRTYDDLLRNSLHEVRAELLLSQTLKRTIPAHEKIILKGQELFFNKFKYQIGGKNQPVQSELYTTYLYEPVQHAPDESKRFAEQPYKWIAKIEQNHITEEEYNNSPVIGDTLPAIYPPPPTEAQYKAGGKYHSRFLAEKMEVRPELGGGYLYYNNEYYLVPAEKDASEDPRNQ